MQQKSKKLWGQGGGTYLTGGRGHDGAGIEAEKARSELGLDRPRSPEVGREGTEETAEGDIVGTWGQEGLKCHSKKLEVDHEHPGEPWKVLELGSKHHFLRDHLGCPRNLLQ